MTVANILRKLGALGKALSGARAFLRLCSAFNRSQEPIGFHSVRGNLGSVRSTLSSSLSARP